MSLTMLLENAEKNGIIVYFKMILPLLKEENDEEKIENLKYIEEKLNN
jgi:hypothetical protein